MKEIAIHFEGGGDTAQQKVEPRTGLGCLLDAQKTAARAKGLGWKLVPSGGRQRAYDALINAMRRGDGTTLNVLPVDSEEALAPEPPPAETESREEKRQRERSNARVRRDHLAYRDGWDLSDVEPEQIHLMVPCMEAWIAADPDGMALYYGQGFRLKSLPRRLNLEDEPKANLYSKLANATKDTSKGE
ncbi:MAG: hypothetical protein ACXWN0_05495, partial [Isosphaeraceae bacterium]